MDEVRQDVVKALKAMDDWCRRRADALTTRSSALLAKRCHLNNPAYRALLGEHRAYMAMRSYIHGSLRPHPILPEQLPEDGITIGEEG